MRGLKRRHHGSENTESAVFCSQLKARGHPGFASAAVLRFSPIMLRSISVKCNVPLLPRWKGAVVEICLRKFVPISSISHSSLTRGDVQKLWKVASVEKCRTPPSRAVIDRIQNDNSSISLISADVPTIAWPFLPIVEVKASASRHRVALSRGHRQQRSPAGKQSCIPESWVCPQGRGTLGAEPSLISSLQRPLWSNLTHRNRTAM